MGGLCTEQSQVAVIQEETTPAASFCTHWPVIHKHSFLDQRKTLSVPIGPTYCSFSITVTHSGLHLLFTHSLKTSSATHLGWHNCPTHLAFFLEAYESYNCIFYYVNVYSLVNLHSQNELYYYKYEKYFIIPFALHCSSRKYELINIDHQSLFHT